jgi:hypothetical protein
MSTYSSRLSYANALKSALATQDKTMMAKLAHPDFVWALPWESAVSGETIGVEAMFDRFARLSEFGGNIEIQPVMISPRGVAMTLHNRPNTARWCSMGDCGNRLRARRHQARLISGPKA